MQVDAQRNWWERNWKWVVPTGCLTLVIAFSGLAASILLIVVTSIKSSWAYSQGLELARANGEVVRELGEPIQSGWFVSGSINVSGSSGEADLAIPLKGPKTTATLYVVATKRAGEWEFEIAQVAVRGRTRRIDLLSRTRETDV